MEESLYDWRKKMGLCVQCGKEKAFSGYVRCPKCIEREDLYRARRRSNGENRARDNEKNKIRMKKIYAERKAAGLCVKCGKQVRRGTLCEYHRLKKNAQYHGAGRERGEAFRERMEKGVCMFCGEEVVPGYKMCKKCLERVRATGKGWRKKDEKNAMQSRRVPGMVNRK